jgi:hypothetical protein
MMQRHEPVAYERRWQPQRIMDCRACKRKDGASRLLSGNDRDVTLECCVYFKNPAAL